MTSEELAAAREALSRTLSEEGRSEDYVKDFLSKYDSNLQNVADWRFAVQQMDRYKRLTKSHSADSIMTALRADENGKPQFLVPPLVMKLLLDLLDLRGLRDKEPQA